MPEQTLIDLGLSKNEAKVYVTLVEIGPSTVLQISEKSGIHRPNVYDSLTKLISRGLAAETIQDSVKYYSVSRPENLLDMIREKEKKAELLIPILKMKERFAPKKSEVQMYKGAGAFMSLFYSLLEYKNDIRIFGAPPPDNIRGQLNDFHEQRVKNKVNLKVIYNFNDKGRIKFARTLKFCEVKHFKEDIQAGQTTVICNDVVLFVVWINPTLVIRVENKDIADGYRGYFKVLWGGAEE